MSGYDVLYEVALERARQDAKWGEQNHPDKSTTSEPLLWGSDAYRERLKVEDNWLDILLEEVAEAAEASSEEELQKELIQIAAVAAAWAEAIDRRRRVREVEARNAGRRP